MGLYCAAQYELCKDCCSWSDVTSGVEQCVCGDDWFEGLNGLCDGGFEVRVVFSWYRMLRQMHWW